MLYTVRLLIRAENMTFDAVNRKLLIGYCLQALELSRHRLYVGSSPAADAAGHGAITEREQAWLRSLEQCILDYVRGCDACDVQEAVLMYISALYSTVASNFYGAAYPLVLVDLLCCLVTKTDRPEAAHRLARISADILLNLGSCIDKLTPQGLLLLTETCHL